MTTVFLVVIAAALATLILNHLAEREASVRAARHELELRRLARELLRVQREFAPDAATGAEHEEPAGLSRAGRVPSVGRSRGAPVPVLNANPRRLEEQDA